METSQNFKGMKQNFNPEKAIFKPIGKFYDIFTYSFPNPSGHDGNFGVETALALFPVPSPEPESRALYL